MLTPSRKLYYAVEAVLYIAFHSDKTPISSRDIADEQGLPPRHLEQIMQKLVRGKVLKGMRGPKGGYTLARPKSQISLGEICQVVNDENTIDEIPPTTELGEAIIRPLWEVLHTSICDRMHVITIDDLCGEAEKKNLQKKVV